MDYAIAVLDIGMTNKKVAIYDSSLKQLEAQYKNFEPLMIDGLPAHDLDAMEEWFLHCLAGAARKYPVKAIAISCHGATFVCVGKDGKACVPCIYYTHEPGDAFHDHFFDLFGNPRQLQLTTGTPNLKAMINSAKGILFAKERFPEQFEQTRLLLHYPQYWAYRLSGVAGAESTYTGCHTYLWDWTRSDLSSVAEKLGIQKLMPEKLHNSWDVLGIVSKDIAKKTGLDPKTILTLGIHDSNSALLPHFAKKGKTGFVLNSTGTWCVIMNPVEEYAFSEEELGKVVFFNQSAFKTPVKTAIFLGGLEFEHWSRLLMQLHGVDELPPYEPTLYRSILAEKKSFILPELTPGSGQFPGSRARVVDEAVPYPFEDIETAVRKLVDTPNPTAAFNDKAIPPCFHDYERGIAVLRISLVLQTLTALERAGIQQGAEVFTEGGFRVNEAYNVLLSSALSKNRLFLSDIAEASAFGAAMTAKMALSGENLQALSNDFTIEYAEIDKETIPELQPYRQIWLELIQTGTNA